MASRRAGGGRKGAKALDEQPEIPSSDKAALGVAPKRSAPAAATAAAARLVSEEAAAPPRGARAAGAAPEFYGDTSQGAGAAELAAPPVGSAGHAGGGPMGVPPPFGVAAVRIFVQRLHGATRMQLYRAFRGLGAAGFAVSEATLRPLQANGVRVLAPAAAPPTPADVAAAAGLEWQPVNPAAAGRRRRRRPAALARALTAAAAIVLAALVWLLAASGGTRAPTLVPEFIRSPVPRTHPSAEALAGDHARQLAALADDVAALRQQLEARLGEAFAAASEAAVAAAGAAAAATTAAAGGGLGGADAAATAALERLAAAGRLDPANVGMSTLPAKLVAHSPLAPGQPLLARALMAAAGGVHPLADALLSGALRPGAGLQPGHCLPLAVSDAPGGAASVEWELQRGGARVAGVALHAPPQALLPGGSGLVRSFHVELTTESVDVEGGGGAGEQRPTAAAAAATSGGGGGGHAAALAVTAVEGPFAYDPYGPPLQVFRLAAAARTRSLRLVVGGSGGGDRGAASSGPGWVCIYPVRWLASSH